MNKKRNIFITLFTCFILGCLFNQTAPADDSIENSLYANLLKKYVKDGVVSYKGFKNEEAKLDQYLSMLEDINIQTLSSIVQYAFYINAYNAWTIKLILTGYPGVKSIKDLGSLLRSPWKKKICRIDGKVVSLDYIEHEVLRPVFKDPRTHFAVNCASKGCPPLRAEPYTGAILEKQLDEMTSAFVNDPKRYRFENDTLYVSSIFKWFSEDFNEDVIGFFLKYAEGDFKKGLEETKGEIKLKYLDYDWSLNGE